VQDIAVPVSVLVKDIKNAIEGAFGFVAVVGELTNLSKAYSGHIYFTLKEGDSQIKCAFFKNQQKMNRTEISNDTEYMVYGRVSVYEPRSEITLIVNLIIPYGEGQDALKLKVLKEKLLKEGVFDAVHKKKIPEYPHTIGVVTSEGGAAIHDIINVARKRFPPAEIMLSPSAVQGKDADKAIVAALRKLTEYKEIDVIIIGRGGGLKEDMEPFNSETLAYAVIESEIPVVSAVGHETDSTILDLSASYSVPTPTAAAELIFPEKKTVLNDVNFFLGQVENYLESRVNRSLMYLDNLVLSIKRPDQIISEHIHHCEKLLLKANGCVSEILHRNIEKLSKLESSLEKNDPKLPMNKGFALIRQDGKTVSKLVNFRKTQSFSITFIDGKTDIAPKDN